MKDKILSISDILVTIILAFAFAAAPSYISGGICRFTLSFLLQMLLYLVLFLGAAYIVRRFLTGINRSRRGALEGMTPGRLERLFQKKHAVIYIALIILAAWIIPLCMLYPGTVINDTWGQLKQYILFAWGYRELWDHHPIVSTLIMGGIIVPLSMLTGQWYIMIFVYVLIQAALTSLAFASCVSYTYNKLGLSAKAAGLMLLFFCIIPVYPAAVQTVSKDALHSWGFVFFTLYYIELARTNGEAVRTRGFLPKFILIIFFCCLTKKTGFIIILLSLIIAIAFLKGARRRLLIPAAASVILMTLIMPAVKSCLNVEPGGKQEMFSLPFQMTARYVTEHADDITPDEYEVLDKVLTMDTLAERYEPTNADPVKGYVQQADDSYYARYIKVWFKQGLRHPGSYISAANAMLAGWFSWSEYAPLMNNDWHNQLDTDLIPEWVASRTVSAKTAEAYQGLVHGLYRIPIVNILLTYGFYAALLPAFALCTVLRRRHGSSAIYWLAVVPTMLALILGCWLAPVSYQLEGKRYLYPVVYTIPLVIAWCASVAYAAPAETVSGTITDTH